MKIKGEWEARVLLYNNTPAVFDANGSLIAQTNTATKSREECEANAQLIVAAVNMCKEVNKDNPMAVAESIEDLYEALIDALDYIQRRMPESLGKDDHMAIYDKAIAKVDNPSAK